MTRFQVPIGTVTRGTTGPNRLRRCDRWLVATQARMLRTAADPLVVDLGFGAHPVTTLELASRLRRVRPDVQVVGLEIDPARVAAALPLAGDGVSFALGGFEVPVGARSPVVVRAFNVLRQYEASDVAGAWLRVAGRLAPGGLLIDGTCDELGRRAAWVCVGRAGAQSLTTSVRLAGMGSPAEVAERLPKMLIHRNVPGERVHAWLNALDGAWRRAVSLRDLGARQRFVATVESVRASGWPVLGGPARWRLGEVSVRWDAVAPR